MCELTARTFLGRPLFRPTPELEEAITGVIGRALQLYPIEMHAYTWLSNHRHLLTTVPDAEVVTEFQTHLNRNTARVVREITGWKGPVWDRASPPIVILDDASAVRRMAYVLSNGVKEGLVESVFDWPGPSSARALASDGRVKARWPRRDPVRSQRVVTRMDDVSFSLAPIAAWRHLTREERAARIRWICADIEAAARRERQGRPALGVRRLLEVDITIPIELEERRPPIAFAEDPALFYAFKRQRDEWIASYRTSASAFQAGKRSVRFPVGAILPSRGFERD